MGESRLDGERIRARASIERLRDFLDAAETDVAQAGSAPIGIYTAQGLVQSAADLAMQIAKMDAYRRCEEDGKAARDE